METTAPSVVAVVVTSDPGPTLADTLRALGDQDYPELSVLVLDAGSETDPTPAVAAVLPDAFVRLLGRNPGFGAAANEVLGMVEGATFFLFCHDDVAPDPDAVHLMVEESFRSNAAVVAPKLVDWEDPRVLLHVGMAVDKGGAAIDRIEPGEIDHGQHDAVLDVFSAPAGCLLVRADLFAELGGFDPRIFAVGEDLDLCWRAQVAGARVVVAPQARVRHREALVSGRRRRAVWRGRGPGAAPAAEHTPVPGAGGATVGELRRRHELHAVLKNYGPVHLARVLPQVAAMAVAEVVLAVVTGDRRRARTVVRAWRWNLGERRQLRHDRRRVAASRRVPDHEVRRLQMHGSARLRRYLRVVLSEGLVAARGRTPVPADEEPTRHRRFDTPAARTGLWVVVLGVLLAGTRQLLGNGLPVVGQLVPLPGVTAMLHRYAGWWQPTGLGRSGPGSPAYLLLGLAGAVLGGSVSTVQKLVVLGCIPVGAWGMARLGRSTGGWRPRAAAVVVYLAVPVAYNDLAQGRWDGLLAYAFTPWLLAALTRAGRIEPLAGRPVNRPWRGTLAGRALGLGLAEATVCALAPSVAALVLVVAAGLALGTLAAGGSGAGRAALRMAATGLGATAVAAVLLVPWSVSVLADPGRTSVLLGPPAVAATGPTLPALLRLAVGPIGDTPLTLAFLVAAAVPLLVGRQWRLGWAVRGWVLAATAWSLAWAGGRGWLGGLALPPGTLLAPAAAGLALAVAAGVAAAEADVSERRFGWRQALPAVGVAAVVVGALPTLVAAGGGRWDLPGTGWGEPTAWMAGSAPGAFRVLWLGDPGVLPGRGEPLRPGLAAELTDGSLPDAGSLWTPLPAAERAGLAHTVALAETGSTVHLGRLLAPYAVRYVVVVAGAAPDQPGWSAARAVTSSAGLVAALGAQGDLAAVPSQGGYDVFSNVDAVPARAVGTAGRWRPVLGDQAAAGTATGRVPAGTLVASVAPADRWRLEVGGRPVPATSPAAATAVTFTAPGGTATLHQVSPGWGGWAVAGQVALWVAVVGGLAGRGWWLDWWWRPLRRRRQRPAAAPATTEAAP